MKCQTCKHGDSPWLFTPPGTHHSTSGHFHHWTGSERRKEQSPVEFFHLLSFFFSFLTPQYLFVPFSFLLFPPSSSTRLTCHSSSFVPTGLFPYWTPRPLHSFGSPRPSQGPNYEPALNKNIYISPKKGFSLCFLWTMRACGSLPPSCSLFLCWVAIHWGSVSLFVIGSL